LECEHDTACDELKKSRAEVELLKADRLRPIGAWCEELAARQAECAALRERAEKAEKEVKRNVHMASYALSQKDVAIERAKKAEASRQQTISGFRSVLSDLIRRIGPARKPEDIKAKLEEIYNSTNAWVDQSAETERDKLQSPP